MWPFKKQEITQELPKLSEFTIETYQGDREIFMAYHYTINGVWISLVTDSGWISYKTEDIRSITYKKPNTDNVVPIRPEAV